MGNQNGRLSPRRERFCREYVKDMNGNQAAIRAGYAPGSAAVTASQLLTDHKVASRVSQLAKRVEEKIEDDAVMLRKNLRAIANVRITDLYNDDRMLKPLSEMSEGALLLISSFKFKDGELTEVKVESKLKAMELLGKHHAVSAWEENVRLSGGDDRVARIRRAQERMGKRGPIKGPIDVTPTRKELPV
jgi:phage terminase small subunit